MARSPHAVVLLVAFAANAWAQTVINVPPDVAPTSIGADTVLNLDNGGELPADFQANSGSVVNIAGGVVGSGFDANDMSLVNITGGRVGSFYARDGSTVDIAGGTFADFGFWTESLSNVTFAGGDFRIDGQLIEGLGGPGSSAPLTIPGDAISGVTFSGTLADGTPFAFSRQESGSRLNGMFTLRAETLPAIGPAVITASTDAIPLGIRSGQTMVVDNGGVLPADFNAGWGSTVEIHEGGVVGRNLEATGATINMSGGESLGDLEVFYGGVLNMSGGMLNPSNDIFSGGVANISGGSAPRIYVWRDAELHFSGDAQVGQVNLAPGSTLTLDGDVTVSQVSFFRSAPQGVTTRLELHGGHLYTELLRYSRTEILVTGGQHGSLSVGYESQLQMTGGEVYGLTVYDGGSATITEGEFARGFEANSGSDITVNGGVVGTRGGLIGESYIRSGATADISGGTFGGRVTAYNGAQATVTGGTFTGGVSVQTGATVSIANATIGESLTTAPGTNVSVVNTSMGDRSTLNDANVSLAGQDIGIDFEGNHVDLTMIGGKILESPYFGNGSSVSLRDVEMGNYAVVENSDLTVDGGAIGRSFTVRGPTSGFVYQTFLKDATVAEYSSISRVKLLIDGGSYASPALISDLRAGSIIRGASFGANTTITGLVRIVGGAFGDNFQLNSNATYDSEITVDGGSIGMAAKIAGKLTVLDGSIGVGLRVSRVNSQVIVAGGSVGDFAVLSNSIVNQTGGEIGDNLVIAGTKMTLSGGVVGENLRVTSNGTLNLIGSGFSLNGAPIEGLIPGERTVLTNRNVTLSGLLADGSPFDFTLQTFAGGADYFDNAIVTLTLFDGLLGDYNSDGAVDAGDYTAWRDTLGDSVTPGTGADHDFSGKIDDGDYYVWRNHYGSAQAPLTNSPEPASIALTVFAALALGVRCRR